MLAIAVFNLLDAKKAKTKKVEPKKEEEKPSDNPTEEKPVEEKPAEPGQPMTADGKPIKVPEGVKEEDKGKPVYLQNLTDVRN